MAEEDKEPKQVKGHCPNCGPDRFADVVGHYKATESDDYVWSETNHRILRCGGCKAVYYQETYVFSEDYDYEDDPHTGETSISYNEKITYWPAPAKRKRPDWLDDLFPHDPDLHELLEQTYKALDSDARILAAIGVRTAFDRASELLKIDTELSFASKLAALNAEGKIGTDEKNHLSILTDAGSAAAHRGWSPTLNELSAMMSLLESFIYRSLILDGAIKKLKPSIPSRKPKK